MNYRESIQKGETTHCDKCQIKMSWVGNSKILVLLFTKAPFPCEQCDSSVEANNLSTCVTEISLSIIKKDVLTIYRRGSIIMCHVHME